jgi:hypothetical protein
MSGECSTYGSEAGLIQAFGGKPEENRPLARHRYRWMGKINMNFGGNGIEKWIGLT